MGVIITIISTGEGASAVSASISAGVAGPRDNVMFGAARRLSAPACLDADN